MCVCAEDYSPQTVSNSSPITMVRVLIRVSRVTYYRLHKTTCVFESVCAFVCLCVCVFACVCVWWRVCVFVCVWGVLMSACLCVCGGVFVCLFVCVCVWWRVCCAFGVSTVWHVCVCMCLRCMCVCVRICAYVRASCKFLPHFAF